MSTFYLNVDSTGVDKLLMGPGIYWSYQTGSTEGPGGTYTLTPVFDTTLITLPSDVQVWYSNDGTNFAYSPAWITSRTGDTITVTVASSITVTAKLYYASGTVVTDENGAEVASVSTVIGGVATTIGAVTVAGSTTPTEGVAETYSATISGNATDQTYLWTTTDGSAVIATPTAASTDITFSTSGPFNVTCTVSSATASDSPQADTLGVTVAAAATEPTLAYSAPDDGAAFGNGCEFLFADATFTTGSAPTNFTSTVCRADTINAWFWIMSSSSDWPAFVAAYPEGGTWIFEYDRDNAAGKYTKSTTTSGWVYTINAGGTLSRPGIQFSQFDVAPSPSNSDSLSDVVMTATYIPAGA